MRDIRRDIERETERQKDEGHMERDIYIVEIET